MSGNTTQYAWDPENRLKQVTLPGGNVVSYKYDAFGRRVERSATVPVSMTTRFVYDGQDVVCDTDGNGVPTADYLNGLGIDDKLRQTTGAASLYFLTDHLGSTRLLTDAVGNVVEQSNYDSFGNNPGSALTRYGYTGRERDNDTGLLYYRARFYDPQLGRFISEDPIGFAGGDINLFGYVWQSPLNFTDPSGLEGGWAPSDWADSADEWLESWRRNLTGLNPDAVNINTGIHYAINKYEGVTNLLRLGRGFGNYYYDNPCTIGADELFADIGRASGIALLLAGPVRGLRIGQSARAVPPSPRTFVSNDPLVGNLANKIESAYPGHVVDVNVPLRNPAGMLLTDADILTRNAVIQVKSGTSAQGLLRQLQRSESVTGLPSVGYGPNLPSNSISSLSRQGALVTSDERLLLQVIKP